MRIAIAFTTALLVTSAALAQSAPQATAPPLPASTAGPLVLEQIHDGWVLAPDFKVTNLDDRTGELAGAYGGRVFDGSLMIGGAGYWLANDSHDFKVAYGGVVVGWQSPALGRIRFGARGLVGGGSATLGFNVPVRAPIAQPFSGPGDIRFGAPSDPRTQAPARAPAATQLVRVRGRDDFLFVEPTASVSLRVTKGIGVSCGVGYRETGQSRIFGDRLNGASANLALQFGW